MQARFAHHHISDVVRFSAIDGERVEVPPQWHGTPGAYGCLQSNLAVVRQARDAGWPDVLLFEDDVVFDDELDARLPRFMAQLPADWDMLYFGGMHRDEPVRVRENVLKLTATTSTYAYALRHTIYSVFLDAHADSVEPIDVRNRLLQERFNCYCFFPHLAWVDGGLSDTQGRVVEPWWLKESLVLGGPVIDRLQQRTLIVVIDSATGQRELARRNLAFAISGYRRLLPGATIVVASSGGAIGDAAPIVDCAQIAIDEIGRGACANEAVRLFGAGHDFYVFADRDIVPTWDVRAHLLKCVDHDAVSSFRNLIHLTDADSSLFVDMRPIDGSSYAARLRRSMYADCSTLTRDAFHRSHGWDDLPWGEQDEDLRLRHSSERLSVFDSPALGLRLFSGCSRAAGAADGA